MKSLILLAAIGSLAAAATMGAVQIQASPSTVTDFCPAQSAGNCSTAATMLVTLSKPADDALVADISQIVSAARARHLSEAACKDTEAGLATLAGAIRDAAVADLAQKLAVSACGDFSAGVATAALPLPPVAGGDGAGPVSSSGSSGQGSSSGPTSSSGASSGSSGTSGTSGSSGTSGTSGCNNGGASSGSSGTSC